MIESGTLLFTPYGIYSDGIPGALLNTNFAGLAGTWSSSNPTVLYVGYNGEGLSFVAGRGYHQLYFAQRSSAFADRRDCDAVLQLNPDNPARLLG